MGPSESFGHVEGVEVYKFDNEEANVKEVKVKFMHETQEHRCQHIM